MITKIENLQKDDKVYPIHLFNLYSNVNSSKNGKLMKSKSSFINKKSKHKI